MPRRPTPPQKAAHAWLQRRHSGRWTARDEDRLQAWLQASPEHRAAWADAQALWHSLGDVAALAQADLQRARQAHAAWRPSWRQAAWPAGALTLALTLAWTSHILPGVWDEPHILQTALGELQTVNLPDGSRIELNTRGRIKVSYSALCRCVDLQAGEAVFTVAHTDLRPFRVAAGAAEIVDVGTAFWVRREPDGVAVAVSEGEVDVYPQGERLATRLRAGQQAAYDARGHTHPAAPTRDVSELTAWRQGDIVFRDAPLGEVLQEFSRYHPVRFELDARLASYRLSGRLASGDLEKLLSLLQAGYPAQAVRVAPDLIRVNFRAS